MVREIKLLDKIHLQKYMYLITSFLSREIPPVVFQEFFVQIRREDPYWLSGLFHEEIGRVLDSLFLDVDEFNNGKSYDPNDKFNIDEKELRERVSNKLVVLNSILGESSR